MSFGVVYVVIITIISYCIFLPIGILYTWQYFSLRKHNEISKRYANIVIIQNGFLMMLIICGMAVPLELVGMINFNVFHPFISSAYGIVYCLLSRLWLYYFDVKYDRAVHQNEWGYMLNEKYLDIEQNLHAVDYDNFFVKYKPFLGKKTFISKLAASMWFLSTLIPFFLWTPWDFHSMTDEYRKSAAYQKRASVFLFVVTLEALIPSVLIGIVRWATPTFNDHLLLRQEFKYILRTIGAIFGVVVVFMLLYTLIRLEWLEDAVTFTGYFLICCGVFGIQLISTKWVLQSMQLHSTQTQNHLMLKNIFLDENLFYEFLSHIRHEFCLETFLAFYEMMFFKQYIGNCYAGEINEESHEFLVEFAADLVKPNRTYKDEIASYDELKDMAYSLYTTYIQKGSDLEINISYSMHTQYTFLMDDYDGWKKKTAEEISINDLYFLYEQCIKEMYKYLDRSCARFKSSEMPKFGSMIALKT